MIKVSETEVKKIRKKLLSWGSINYRDFPWRVTSNPYHVLVAEIMLQRTKANQVVDVYNKFIEMYPTLALLAESSSEQMFRIVYPLGLKWRFVEMQKMAKQLYLQEDEEMPKEREQLMSLPGIGEYIAGAIMICAFGKRVPLLDTNIVRIIGRVFGLNIKESSRKDPKYLEIVDSLLSIDNPRKMLYAILDLGNAVCLKKNEPKCVVCPIKNHCNFFITSSLN